MNSFKIYRYLIFFTLLILPLYGDPFVVNSSLQAGIGFRLDDDPDQREQSLYEARLQLDISKLQDWGELKIKADLLYDDIEDEEQIDLTNGEGWIDLREANLLLYPLDFMDIKVGRQILTWGTGDLLFLNDLFPKDWKSFFIGRDDTYLKAPSDAIRLSLFSDLLNLEIAYTPKFNPDRSINGRRLSYYSPQHNAIVGNHHLIKVQGNEEYFEDDEFALRIHKNIQGLELVFYGYLGYWKTPAGINPVNNKATYPELAAFGNSLRTSFFKGIINFEWAYYNSKDDSEGESTFIRNSELRLLVGYEQELYKDTSLGLQFYLEQIQDYDNYKENLFPGEKGKDENRQVITIRLIQLFFKQTLSLSNFIFYSPTDQDGYFRPRIEYKYSDHLSFNTGANIFFGTANHTFFKQFHQNNNLFFKIKYDI